MGGTSLNLCRERLPVDSAMNRHIIQPRVAFYGVIFSVHLDHSGVMSPPRVIDLHLGVTVIPLGVQGDDRVLLAHFDVIAGQLPAQARRTLA